jgi:hypothetical protein
MNSVSWQFPMETNAEGRPNDFFVLVDNKMIAVTGTEIVDLATESSFGSYTLEKNILDPSIRKAKEIKAGLVYVKEPICDLITEPSPDPEPDIYVPLAMSMALVDLHVQVSKILKRQVKIVPYKLNIYETGSFFSFHVDSLKKPNNICTLLVGLSDDYDGGLLEIVHKDLVKSHKIGLHECVLLYGSCKHRVTEVTRGTRLTLAFDVYAVGTTETVGTPETVETEQETPETVETPDISDTETTDSLVYDDSDFMSDLKIAVKKLYPVGKEKRCVEVSEYTYVAYQLDHDYAVACPNYEWSGCPTTRKCLKGKDLMMYDYFSKIGRVHLVELYKAHVDNDSREPELIIYDEDGSYSTSVNLFIGDNLLLIGELWNEKSNELPKDENGDYDYDCGSDMYAGNQYCSSYSYYGTIALVVNTKDLVEYYKAHKTRGKK